MKKQELSRIMLPEIEEIVSAWDENGIIIETQFAFAASNLEREYMSAYEIIVENGGHAVGEIYAPETEIACELSKPLCMGVDCSAEGWMYCFYDPYILDSAQATDAVQKHMRKNPTFRK